MKPILSILVGVIATSVYAQDLDYLPKANGQLITHTYYSVSYIEEHEQPEWVAYYLSVDMLKKVYERKDSFRENPAVTTGSATYADYTSDTSYDAGHLLPCRQMQFDCDAMSETFYMSNMSPQRSKFNRYKWSALERLERNMAFRNDGLYVVSGPVLSSVSGAIGDNEVSIPEFYYKILLKYDDDEKKAIAFLLPNRHEPPALEDYVVSIDYVEALTGIDFFASLPDSQQRLFEANSDKSKWSFANPQSKFGYTVDAQKCAATISPDVQQNKIGLNSATKSEIESLPGIGASNNRKKTFSEN
ncbi:MAG: DNA/RNA non-specific endonuclease [Reichenbachiella sp.]